MCLSTLYRDKIDSNAILVQNIASFKEENGELVFKDLLEREYRFHASFVCADLSDAYIIIHPEDGWEVGKKNGNK